MEFLQLIETSWARWLYKFTLYKSQSETESHHPSTGVWCVSFPVIKFVVGACASTRDMVPHKVGNLWPLEKVGSKIHLALLKKLIALPKTNIFPKKSRNPKGKDHLPTTNFQVIVSNFVETHSKRTSPALSFLTLWQQIL